MHGIAEEAAGIARYLEGQLQTKVRCDEQYFGQSELRHFADAIGVGIIVLVETRSTDQAFCFVPPEAVQAEADTKIDDTGGAHARGKDRLAAGAERACGKVADILVLCNNRRRHVLPCSWEATADDPRRIEGGFRVRTPTRTDKDIVNAASAAASKLQDRLSLDNQELGNSVYSKAPASMAMALAAELRTSYLAHVGAMLPRVLARDLEPASGSVKGSSEAEPLGERGMSRAILRETAAD